MPDYDPSVFCQNVRMLRRANGYTVRQLAKLCWLTPSMVRKLERNVIPRGLGCRNLALLAYHFHLTPTQLLCPLPADTTSPHQD